MRDVTRRPMGRTLSARPSPACGSAPASDAFPADGLWARQRDFAAAILDPAREVPPGLVDPDGDPSPRRFAVYRNNVVVGLTQALSAAYPVVQRLLGEAFFAAMARIFVAHEPPRSPVMLDYGEGFARFLAAFEPAAGLAYLPDVARLERAWLEAYHAAEAHPLAPEVLAALPPDIAPRLVLGLHPSLRLVRSAFPVVSIWRLNVDDDAPSSLDPDAGPEDALILRPAGEVEVRALPPGAAFFIAALSEGRPLQGSTVAALAEDPRFDLADTLAGLLAAGAVTGWSVGGEIEAGTAGRAHEHAV